MKLLDEIIDLLSDEKGSLTSALLKTKVLMHKIGHAELAEWVNDELSGYPAGKPVPEYRIVHGQVIGNIQNMMMIQSGVTLPIAHLPVEKQRFLTHSEMRQPIKVLEEWTSNNENSSLAMKLPPEFYAEFDEALNGYWVQTASIRIATSQIQQGLSQIRSRLLDFVLGLQDKVGHINDEEVKEMIGKEDVPKMFHSIMAGDNATFVFGSNNTTTITNTVKKGDFESLAAALKTGQVADADIAELKDAIAADGEPKEKGQFGTRVKAWMGKMTQKAIDGSWTIGLSAGGKLIADGLATYFGWN